MSPLLTQRTSLALLASLGLALAYGLLAAGPISLGDEPSALADQRIWFGLPQGLNALSCAPLVLVAISGLVGLRRNRRWPDSLRRPLAAYFGLSVVWSALAGIYHLAPTHEVMGGIHGLAAASAVLLTLVFLAERFGLQFGSVAACSLGVAVTAVACLGWWADGDGRWLLWLQALPVLLVATGLLGQPGRFTRTSEWGVMLALYIGARVAGWMDHVIFEATGSISGHTVMHLASAGVAAVMARRVWRSAGDGNQPAALSGPNRLSTSFHTTG